MCLFDILWLPFGYTLMRYYSNWRSLIKYVLTEYALLVSLSFYFGATYESFLVSFIQFYSVYDVGYLDNDYNARRLNEEIRVWSQKSIERIGQSSGKVIKTKLLISAVITSLLLFRSWEIRYLLSFLLVGVFIWFNRVSEKKLRVCLFVILAVFKPVIVIFNSLSEVKNLLNIHSFFVLFLSLFPYLSEKVVEYVQVKLKKTKNQTPAARKTIFGWFIISISAFKIGYLNLNDLILVFLVGGGSVFIKKVATHVKLRTQ